MNEAKKIKVLSLTELKKYSVHTYSAKGIFGRLLQMCKCIVFNQVMRRKSYEA